MFWRAHGLGERAAALFQSRRPQGETPWKPERCLGTGSVFAVPNGEMMPMLPAGLVAIRDGRTALGDPIYKVVGNNSAPNA